MDEKQAGGLRARLIPFVEDWEQPEPSIYDEAVAFIHFLKYFELMSITVSQIKSVLSNKELFDLLAGEVQNWLPPVVHCDAEAFPVALKKLPIPFRTMAAIHGLDVSMAMDDLGWHFYNFQNWEIRETTHSGLIELEAVEAGEIFGKAVSLVEPHWETIDYFRKAGQTKDFAEWYQASSVKKQLKPLNKKLWVICENCGELGLLQYWIDYARKYPAQFANRN